MSTITTHAPLSTQDVLALGAILEMARNGDKVVYLQPEEDREVRGVARHLSTTSGGGGLDPAMDVRDAYLRITTSTGLESWFPIADLMAAFTRREFVAYDWS